MQKLLTLLCLIGLGTASVFAHGAESHFANKQDVTVKTTKVNGNVYMLQGRGGNVGALVGMEGILIVDDDYKVVSEKLAAALKELGAASPKYILNTHWHGDHTEGNLFFGKESVIVAHANVRKRLLDPPVIFGQKTPAYPSFALPSVMYNESMSLHFAGEDIKLVHFPNGHTDGDTIVFFTKANVVHFGDHFFKGFFPFVDLDSGGSVQGVIKNVATLIKEIPADAKLIPGHGGLATLADLKEYHAALVDTSNIVEERMKQKQTLEQIKKAGLPEKYETWGSGFIKTEMWIEILYRSYSQK